MKISFLPLKGLKSTIFGTFILGTLFFYSCSPGYKMISNDSWKLVYENDKDGNTLCGDIDKLIEEVQNGKEVRVLTISDNIKYITEAESIWIQNGIVSIENTKNVSASHQGDNLIILDDAYYWYFTLNTKGFRFMSRWSVGEHISKGNNSDRVGVKWFVK